MKQLHHTLEVTTDGPALHEITKALQKWVWDSGLQDGLLTLMVQHTSASLTVQENADPDVRKDLVDALVRLAPADRHMYRHTCEGSDDMPAHIKSALTNVNISIPVMEGQLRLGTWQGVYLIEHRSAPHRRRIALHLIGE